MRRHLFIPDIQATEDSPNDHLRWIGEYIVDKKPDVVVQIGDFADMPSLGIYDRGKISFEGRRYKNDIKASNKAFDVLNKPIEDYNKKRRRDKKKVYLPDKHLTLGNHEDRITRTISENAILDGTLSLDDLNYKDYGWEVHPFLKPVVIDGVSYCHYFYNRQSGKPIGGANISTRINNIGFPFVQGHQQMYMVGIKDLSNGTRHRGLVCGACYLHSESYRGYQANNEWRGVFLLNEVQDGDYVLNEVSLDFLCRRYEGVGVDKFMTSKYPKVQSPFNKIEK